MHSTGYIIRFVLFMTALVAVILSVMSTGLSPLHKKNEAIFNKRAILAALGDNLPEAVDQMDDDAVQELFTGKITQHVLNMDGEIVEDATVVAAGYPGGKAEHVDMSKERKKPEAQRLLPLFIYDAGAKKYYIISVRGSGLWDEIWGNIALEDDFDTIAGVAFDHRGETPGLGAEIKDNQQWADQFIGKEIYNDAGELVSVDVIKAGAKDPDHEVDGITGATITADGVSEMMNRGVEYYGPYFEKQLDK